MYRHEKTAYPKLDRRRVDMHFKPHARNNNYKEVLFMILREKTKLKNSQTIDFVSFAGYTIIEKLK